MSLATNKITFLGVHSWCDIFNVSSSVLMKRSKSNKFVGSIRVAHVIQIKFDVEYAVVFVCLFVVRVPVRARVSLTTQGASLGRCIPGFD